MIFDCIQPFFVAESLKGAHLFGVSKEGRIEKKGFFASLFARLFSNHEKGLASIRGKLLERHGTEVSKILNRLDLKTQTVFYKLAVDHYKNLATVQLGKAKLRFFERNRIHVDDAKDFNSLLEYEQELNKNAIYGMPPGQKYATFADYKAALTRFIETDSRYTEISDEGVRARKLEDIHNAGTADDYCRIKGEIQEILNPAPAQPTQNIPKQETTQKVPDQGAIQAFFAKWGKTKFISAFGRGMMDVFNDPQKFAEHFLLERLLPVTLLEKSKLLRNKTLNQYNAEITKFIADPKDNVPALAEAAGLLGRQFNQETVQRELNEILEQKAKL